MSRRFALTALLALAALPLLAGPALAQRGYGRYRNAAPMTPFGPEYDPSLMRQAGGNPLVYQQLAEQRMMQMQLKQMQQMQKQMQQFQKMQQQAQKAGSNSTKTTQKAASPLPPRRVKKKHITPPITSTKIHDATDDDSATASGTLGTPAASSATRSQALTPSPSARSKPAAP